MYANHPFVGALVRLWNHEEGTIISAELVLVTSIAGLSMIVGLRSSHHVTGELSDIAQAIGSLNQSYVFTGMAGCTSGISGSSSNDDPDVCDCVPIDNFVGHITVADKCE